MVRVGSKAAALALAVAIAPIAAPTALHAQYVADRRDHGRPPAADYTRAGYPPRDARDEAPPPRDRSRCNRGMGGAIIGAIAGGLLGNTVAGRGDRGFGTILGAGAGALAGHEIDRDC